MKGSPSAPNQPHIILQMTDADVVSRAATLLGVGWYNGRRPQKSHHKQSYTARVKGSNAVRLMRQLRPLMGIRRCEQIDRALASYRGDLRRTVPSPEIDRIKVLIKQGVSQWDISKQMKVSRSTVAMIATGKRHNY